jgi:hypothetical protein
MRQSPISEQIAMAPRAVILLAALGLAGQAAPAGDSQPKEAKKQPAGNLEFWLNQAKPVTTQPAASDANGVNPFQKTEEVFSRQDALPGVIELSNGKQLPGGVYTTLEKPWIVWEEQTKSWRRIPLINCLSVTAVVEQERMELRWRWKGMGEPEKVYTGEKYPFRRLHWRFRLIDGSVVEGSTKGQPIFVELRGRKAGPFVLHERMKGNDGQTLGNLVYVRKIVISRKMMHAIIEDIDKQLERDSKSKPKRPAGAL